MINLNKYEVLLTKELQNTIRDLGLVDSGKMLNVTKVIIEYDKDLDINIDSTDYFNFVDEKYKITDIWLSKSITENIIKDMMIDIMEDSL